MDREVNTMRRRLRVVAFLVIPFALGACTSGGGETDSGATVATVDGEEASAPDTTEGVATGRTELVVATASDLTTLDMGLQDGFFEVWILDNIYDSLTRRGPDGSAVPHIATDWQVSEDALEWTLTIRTDVVFHNGDPLTAEDVEYSLERLYDPDYPLPPPDNLANVDDVEVIDDETIVVRLNQPTAGFIHESVFFNPIVPKSVGESMSFEEFGAMGMGSGPYEIVEWRRDDRLILTANEDYFLGAPAIKDLIFRPIPDQAARTAALQTGEVQLAADFPITQIDVIENTDGLEVRSVEGLGRQRMTLDTNNPPFDQVEVRQALNYAIDKQAIIDSVMAGFGEPLAFYALPIETGFNDELDPYPYDPDKARDLLAGAGYGDGFEVDFHVRTNYPKAEEASQAIANYLSEVGIETNLILVSAGDFQRIADEGQMTMGYTGHGGGGAFHASFGLLGNYTCQIGSNSTAGYYCSDDLDALANQYVETAPFDEPAALEMLKEIQRICYEDACQGNLWSTPYLYGASTSLVWEPDPTGTLWMKEAYFTE